MVGIHHLAWVNDLDAGAIVLVQRHEGWIVATANCSMCSSRTTVDSYMTDYERPQRFLRAFIHVRNWQYRWLSTSMQDNGHAGRSVLEKQVVGERRIDYQTDI